MAAFGSVSLANKFAIVLCSLVALSFGAGLIKLYINKRRLKKHTKLADLEAAGKRNDREKLVGRQLEEGDLFGVRALEHGYFGGVAQSRPSSPAPSYVLSPSTTVVDWGETGKHSASSSVTDTPGARNGSISSIPTTPQAVKKKPSPLRVPLNGRMQHGLPLPPPKSARSVSSSGEGKGWVSPLDVHFSRPTTPSGASRPQSCLPRLQFPGEMEKTGLLVPTPSDSVKAKSEAASIISRDISPTPTAEKARTEPSPAEQPRIEPLRVTPPTFSVFPSIPIPSRAARQAERSIFPRSDDSPRPSSRGKSKVSLGKIPIPPIPKDYDDDYSKRLGPESPIIRDSVVSKRRVSVYQPTKPRSESPNSTNTHDRAQSVTASSIYSTTTSILDVNKDSSPPSSTSQHTLARSRSTSTEAPRRNRDRSSSSHHQRRSFSYSLSRTQNSLRHHGRKLSTDTLRNEGRKRSRSRERDQIHYDPRNHHRNRSGSVQGRSIDFDHPRESPFSNAHATSTHSANTSISSSGTTTVSNYSDGEAHEMVKIATVPKPPALELNLIPESDQDRLSVNIMTGMGADGRLSVASKASLGDFYDAYYRQSTIGMRTSILQGQGSTSNVANPETIGVTLEMGAGKSQTPLKLGGGLGAGRFAGETIVEVPSAAPSPMIKERFPTRI